MRLAAALETTRIHSISGLDRGECQPTLMSTGDGKDTEAILRRIRDYEWYSACRLKKNVGSMGKRSVTIGGTPTGPRAAG
jgi:hypothetical protein